MSYVFKIAKAGYDAKTANPENLILSSELNHLKTASSGSISRTGNGTNSISHGLGYKPLCIAYFRLDSGSTWYITLSGAPTTSPNRYSAPGNVSMYCSDTYVYFKSSVGSGVDIVINYEIFYEGV